jgi:hypothetical protein
MRAVQEAIFLSRNGVKKTKSMALHLEKNAVKAC